ncbi:MAG: RNA polymerase sigma factor [Acidobacteria bacterium]|nr:RNA polymerase sigma factor [Acidobacteriota bacterium]
MKPDSAEPQDDRQLVDASRAGDPSAFEELVRRKTGKVFGLCCRILGNREDAKDVAQLVFVKLWENLGKYDSSFAFDTWLYRMTSNVAIDFIRSRQSREATQSSSLRLIKTSDEAAQGHELQHKEIEQVFEQVSRGLSPKQKTVFVMHAMEDLQLAEIARVLGTKESTVRNHLFNARKTMQKELRRRYPEYSSLWKEREA